MSPAKGIPIGLIGGSGLYQIDSAKQLDELQMETPFGEPSDCFKVLDFDGKKVAFLPRHGRGHKWLPSELNNRANIWAFKAMGVQSLISVSAVGSLQEKFQPGQLAVPTQLIDRTQGRAKSFFGEGVAGHVSLAEPFCQSLRKSILAGLKKSGLEAHAGGTYVCIEGPAFSTRAESQLYRSWNCDLVGMTALPEAQLAREAEISYAQISMITDYDSWREDHAAVDVAQVMQMMKVNSENVKKALPHIIDQVDLTQTSSAHSAAQYAVMTDKDLIPEATWKKISLFYDKYL